MGKSEAEFGPWKVKHLYLIFKDGDAKSQEALTAAIRRSLPNGKSRREMRFPARVLGRVSSLCGFRESLLRLRTSLHMLPEANPQTSARSNPSFCKQYFS